MIRMIATTMSSSINENPFRLRIGFVLKFVEKSTLTGFCLLVPAHSRAFFMPLFTAWMLSTHLQEGHGRSHVPFARYPSPGHTLKHRYTYSAFQAMQLASVPTADPGGALSALPRTTTSGVEQKSFPPWFADNGVPKAT